jgi:hypothetical protein
MANGAPERRLAAILAADVAGYSRLMGEDEEGTLARLTAHRRELFDPAIERHRGRIVKTTGDGLLAEFQSVVDAVRCAAEVQSGMASRNDGAPANQRIAFRIGINVGDIVEQDGDIFGDGVNIAAAGRHRRAGRGVHLAAGPGRCRRPNGLCLRIRGRTVAEEYRPSGSRLSGSSSTTRWSALRT